MPRQNREEILEQLKELREMTKVEIEQEFEKEKVLRADANKREKEKEKASRKEMLEAGINVEQMERKDAEESEAARKRIERVRKELIGVQLRREDYEFLAQDEALLADSDAVKMPLVGRELYASAPEFLAGIDGDVLPTSAVPYDPHTANPWCWARGGGWWGSASISIYSTFWFYFYPGANRYYSVLPWVRYRGFYILNADDKWWNSKYARVAARPSRWQPRD